MPIYVNPQSSYFDKSFNNTPFHSCILSMQMSMHGVLISVYDDEKNKFIGLESFRLVGLKNENQVAGELDSLIKEREWLTDTFKKINIIYLDPITTLIPQALFEEKNKELYLNFNQITDGNTSVNFNLLKNAAAVNVFRIPKSVEVKIKTLWPDTKFFHPSSVFIESLLINYKNKTTNKKLFVQVNHDYFEVVYLKDGKLSFHNTFKFRSKEDFIYFLLTTIEQLKLNPEEVNVILSGLIDKSSIYYEMVYQYIRNNEFIERNETFNYSYLFDNLAHHKYYVLFNMLQCE